MKKKFLKTIAAVAMIFSFAGFVRAQDGLKITASLENAGVTLQAGENSYTATDVVLSTSPDTKTTLTLTCDGADIYYTIDGTTTPSKPQTEQEGPVQTDETATKVFTYSAPIELEEEMFSGDASKQLVVKAIAYKAAAAENEAQATATEETSDVLTITLTLKAEEQQPAQTVATPTFKINDEAVASGTTVEFTNDTVVKIECATTEATIRYTTADENLDGETSGTAYTTAGVTISTSCTLKAKAFKADMTASEVATLTFTKREVSSEPEPTVVAAPKIDTIKKLDGKDSAVVVVFDAEKADGIFVATGKTLAEATAFTQYTKNDTIVLSQDTVVRACAVKGEVHSDTVTYVYTKPTVTPDPEEPEKVAVPTFATRNGAEADTIVVLLGEADSIFVAKAKDTVSAYAASFAKYTEDAKIVADQDTLVFIAYAVKGTDKVHSDTVAYRYIKPTVTPDPEEPETVAVPTFETKAGAEADTIVVLLGEADSIFVAKAKDTVSAYAASFAKYTEDAKIIADQDTLVFIAYAVKEEVHSDTVAYRYIKATVTPDPEEPEKVAAPVIDTIKGQDKADSVVIVKFDATKADSIFVATGKDLAAATAFAKFTKNDTIVLSQDTAVRAYAMKDGKYSDTVRYIYTATVTPEPEKDTVATPVFSLKGEVNKGDTLYITCATEGAEIFYALDTVKFVKYENGIEITEDVTVKAFAKKGEIVSDTVEVSLTVKTQANEGKELSGVSIYPNPSNGEFKVAVPVNATVEMFNTNGQMVKRANLVAGVNTLRMNNSGIYFVRFTAANGQVVIKKVIVR